jgi:hypothetical protein
VCKPERDRIAGLLLVGLATIASGPATKDRNFAQLAVFIAIKAGIVYGCGGAGGGPSSASFLATSLPVGVHVMAAQYSGDSNTFGSTSVPLLEAITGQVIVEITGSSNEIVQTADFTVATN